MKKILPSTYYSQKTSEDCGLATVKMLLDYYQIHFNKEELERKLKIYPNKMGIFPTQIGIFLLDLGFEVEIVTFHPSLFNKTHHKLEIDQNYFKECRCQFNFPKDILVLDFYEKFLDKGGKILPQIPNFEIIKNEIENNRPTIAILTTNCIKNHKIEFNSHFNMITGFDENHIYANDPHPDIRGGKNHKYNKEEFFYGIYAGIGGSLDNGSILKIKL